MCPRYLQYLLTDFRQTFVTGASWDTDDLITFLGQNVKVQGHTIMAEAHSTRRYRRVQLFLVYFYLLFVFCCSFIFCYRSFSRWCMLMSRVGMQFITVMSASHWRRYNVQSDHYLSLTLINVLPCLTGWLQTWKTWNTQGFLWTWKTQGILCKLGEKL